MVINNFISLIEITTLFFRTLIASTLSVVCCVFLHRSDYLRSGGFDTNLNEWGCFIQPPNNSNNHAIAFQYLCLMQGQVVRSGAG